MKKMIERKKTIVLTLLSFLFLFSWIISSPKEQTTQSLERILNQMLTYDYGEHEEILSQLRDYVHSHRIGQESRKELEKSLASFLKTEAAPAAKQEVCRYLRVIGTDASVPALAWILSDPHTSDMARYALESISGEAADNALIHALHQTAGKTQIGIITSLGTRRIKKAVPDLGRLLRDENPEVAIAAAAALGKIADEEASKVLLQALPDEESPLQIQAAASLLSCAEEFHKNKKTDRAFGLFDRLFSLDLPFSLRQSALLGKLATSGQEAEKIILGILRNKEPDLYPPAIRMIRPVFDETGIQSIIEILHNLPVRSQLQVIEVLSHYPRNVAVTPIAAAIRSGSKEVRVKALEALGRLGEASQVEILVDSAAHGDKMETDAARSSLYSLRGPEVDQKILADLVKATDPALEGELIRSIGTRRIQEGKKPLIDKALSSSSQNRLLAIRALKQLVTSSDLYLLLDLLLESQAERQRSEIRTVIASSVQESSNPMRRTQIILNRLKNSKDNRDRSILLRALGDVGEDSSLPYLRQALKSKDDEIYDAAVRALAGWPNTIPSDDLIQIAQSAESKTHRILALRAFIRMAGLEEYRLANGIVDKLEKALSLAERAEERKMVLSLLPRFPCPGAFRVALSLLDDSQTQAEASLAIKLLLSDYLRTAFMAFKGYRI